MSRPVDRVLSHVERLEIIARLAVFATGDDLFPQYNTFNRSFVKWDLT